MAIGAVTFQHAEPLSQVVFVHNYVQFRFQDVVLSVFSRLTVTSDGRVLNRPDPGFCDALVKLIEKRVAATEYSEGKHMRLTFTGGSVVSVSLRGEDAMGPELFLLDRPGLPTVVGRVA